MSPTKQDTSGKILRKLSEKMEKTQSITGQRGRDSATANLCQVQQQDSGTRASDISILIKGGQVDRQREG